VDLIKGVIECGRFWIVWKIQTLFPFITREASLIWTIIARYLYCLRLEIVLLRRFSDYLDRHGIINDKLVRSWWLLICFHRPDQEISKFYRVGVRDKSLPVFRSCISQIVYKRCWLMGSRVTLFRLLQVSFRDRINLQAFPMFICEWHVRFGSSNNSTTVRRRCGLEILCKWWAILNDEQWFDHSI
jgi:hypothetical protein